MRDVPIEGEFALHIFWTSLLGLVAFLWAVSLVEMAIGVRSIPSLRDIEPLADSACPSLSILFAGRDEAEKLPGAIETMLGLDYPEYEVVAVNDRSSDGTGAILEAAARKNPRLKPVRIDSLPRGWLGKPHALQQAYEHSRGEWLVFTDADVHFEPDVLRRVLGLAQKKGWEHMTLFASPKLFTFGEKIVMAFFGVGFLMGTKPWKATDPLSSGYTGMGAFQLIKRSAYEKMGTHKRLAMEVIDDMKLGKLAKEAGARSGIAKPGSAVSVHWHAGLGNIIRGTTKNFFASSGYRLWLTSLHVFGLLLMCVFPVAALPFARGWALAFAGVAVGIPLFVEAGVALEIGASPLFALTYPLGAAIFAWMLTRSTIITLWRGGIEWRGTFYPIEELKKGVV